MLGRGKEFVAQNAVLGRTYSGPGWTRWSLAAFNEYESLDAAGRERLAEAVTLLWADKRIKAARLLRSPSPAGHALLNRSLGIHGNKERPTFSVDVALATAHERTLGEAALWSGEVADFIEGVYALPSELFSLITDIARQRQLPLPAAIDLDNRSCLVTAARTLISLEQALYEGAWPQIDGSTLSLEEGCDAMQLVLALREVPGTLAKNIGSKTLGSGFPSAAMDGYELEVRDFHIHHVPEPASPLRTQVRDRMIQIVDDFLANPTPRQEKFGRARTAAETVVGIGDKVAIAKIIDWLANHPTQSGSLIPDYLFDTYAYEIDIRGRRRDLTLGYTIPLYGAPAPSSRERRSVIEVLRPTPAKCGECGGKMVALFDVLFDPAIHKGLPAARRVYVSCCPKCSQSAEGYWSRLRLDDRWSCDVDAWPCEEATEAGVFEARCFVVDKPSEKAHVGGHFGGLPRWEQDPNWPKCHQCRRRMVFLGQAECTPTYYGFYCPDCQTTNVRTQYD
jgi:hypothetical protein